MNLKEVVSVINSYQNYEQQKIEYESRQTWEVARWQAFLSMLPHVKKNALKKPTDLAKFPWDEVQSVHIDKDKIFTEEDNAWFERMKKIPPKI